MFPEATSQNVKLRLFEILDKCFKDIKIGFFMVASKCTFEIPDLGKFLFYLRDLMQAGFDVFRISCTKTG